MLPLIDASFFFLCAVSGARWLFDFNQRAKRAFWTSLLAFPGMLFAGILAHSMGVTFPQFFQTAIPCYLSCLLALLYVPRGGESRWMWAGAAAFWVAAFIAAVNYAQG